MQSLKAIWDEVLQATFYIMTRQDDVKKRKIEHWMNKMIMSIHK